MRRSITMMIFLMVIIAFAVAGCYRDVISPEQDPNGPPQFVSFHSDLVPIFTANCANSGCHDANGKKPQLSPDKAFNSIMSNGYANVLVPDKSVIYTVAKPGGAMPTLNPKDLQKVLDWIRNGAPNN